MVLDLNTCTGCRACMAACAMENETPFWSGKFRTHVEDTTEGEFPNVTRTILPRLCMQCENPPCVSVCPTGASHKADGGIVIVDADKCIGCKLCIDACPYQARFMYDAEDVKKAQAVFPQESKAETADKCNLCGHRLEENRDPACVSTCLGEARIFGDLDDPKSQVAKLVARGKAKPLRPELGTKPKVFYLGGEG
jgi:Fe-S-cluster-containing dehydrogenase component